MANLSTVRDAALGAIREFYTGNRVLSAISEGAWMREDYARLLLNLYHQVQTGTLSFGVAAAACDGRRARLREYLLAHAAEEIRHYEWAHADLRSIGIEQDPAQALPSPEVLAFIAFNHFMATFLPPARLASSAVLEGLARRADSQQRLRLVERMGLSAQNFSFILNHSVADESHENEVWEVLGELTLSETEWAWMAHAATVAGQLYKRMYDATVPVGRLAADRRELQAA
jgi:hypothetical protein